MDDSHQKLGEFIFKHNLFHVYKYTNEEINPIIHCVATATRNYLADMGEHKINEYFDIVDNDFLNYKPLFNRAYKAMMKEIKEDIIRLELFEFMPKFNQLEEEFIKPLQIVMA